MGVADLVEVFLVNCLRKVKQYSLIQVSSSMILPKEWEGKTVPLKVVIIKYDVIHENDLTPPYGFYRAKAFNSTICGFLFSLGF